MRRKMLLADGSAAGHLTNHVLECVGINRHHSSVTNLAGHWLRFYHTCSTPLAKRASHLGDVMRPVLKHDCIRQKEWAGGRKNHVFQSRKHRAGFYQRIQNKGEVDARTTVVMNGIARHHHQDTQAFFQVGTSPAISYGMVPTRAVGGR